MKNLLVMKFGGTSMGSAERIRVAAGICRGRDAEAAGGGGGFGDVEDHGPAAGHHATRRGGRRTRAGGQLAEIAGAAPGDLPRAAARRRRARAALAGIDALIAEFQRIATACAMLGERPPRSVDEAVAIGERLSALLMAAYLECSGRAGAGGERGEVIVTDAVFGNATPLMDATRRRATETAAAAAGRGDHSRGHRLQRRHADGRPTTLGRGGSDFSASILAAALDAGELWIWTDVDGIMTADPRLVPDARRARRGHLRRGRRAGLQRRQGAASAHAGAAGGEADPGLEQEQLRAWRSRAPRSCHTTPAASGPRAVTSMANVALISIEPASAALTGTRRSWRARSTRSPRPTSRCWRSPVPATARASASWCARRNWRRR